MALAEAIEVTINEPHRLPHIVRTFAMQLPHDRERVVPELIERVHVIETLSSGRLRQSMPDVVLGTYDALTQLSAWLDRQQKLGTSGAHVHRGLPFANSEW